jgi:hypothetical protein
MPRKAKRKGDFDKASIKAETKEILKKIALDEGLFEYELIDQMIQELYPSYCKKE